MKTHSAVEHKEFHFLPTNRTFRPHGFACIAVLFFHIIFNKSSDTPINEHSDSQESGGLTKSGHVPSP